MHGCFCVSVGLCVQHTLHLGIREWWAIESIRHVISKAVHLSIWVSEILRGKCRVCIPPWEPRVLQLLMLAFLGLFNVHTREELMQKKKEKKKLKQSRFCFISLFLSASALHCAQSCTVSSTLFYTTPCSSFLTCLYSPSSSCWAFHYAVVEYTATNCAKGVGLL